MEPRDAGDEVVDAGGLVAAHLRVFQVAVVDDLGDSSESWLFEVERAEHHLEGAELAIVRERGIEHVEAYLARGRGVPSRRNELEGRMLVDEAPDEPGAGDPVDM